MKIMKCEMCGKEHLVEIIKQTSEVYIKDELVEYEETVYFCSNCDEDEAYFIPAKIMNENLMNARNAYRKKKGLLLSNEIVKFREKYNLSQIELSKIMDFGEATISRYESKSIQDETHDNMLRIVMNNPLEFLKLLDKNKNQFESYNYELIRNHIINVISSHDNAIIKRQNLNNYYALYSEPSIENGYAVLNIDKLEQVINFFAEKINELNKVHLMKLLWYGDSLAFKETGKAITGLVYQHEALGALPLGHNAIMELSGIDVHESYNFDFNYPTYTIYPKINSNAFLSDTEIDILERVCKKFKNYTGKQIADYMHKETAYTNTLTDEIITFNYAREIKDF